MFNAHKESIIVAVVAALLFGAGGYALGSTGAADGDKQPNFAQGMPAQFGSGMMGGNGTGMNRPRTQGGGFVTGAIIAADDTSITVETRGVQSGTNGTKIVFLSDSTQVTKSTEGALADLSIGKEVVITGTTNTDGSLTAKTVQLRPASTTMMLDAGAK